MKYLSRKLNNENCCFAGCDNITLLGMTLPYCYNWMINELGIEAVTYEEGDEIERSTIRKRAEDDANVPMEILTEKE